jgi:hypothetical protein
VARHRHEEYPKTERTGIRALRLLLQRPAHRRRQAGAGRTAMDTARWGHPKETSNVNSLDEVPDSSWYTNRHHLRRMSAEELERGPNRGSLPDFELRAALEPVMVKYGVDVVLSGHEHFYERIKPQKAIHYFIVVSSGQLRESNIGKTALTEKGFDRDNAFMLAEIIGDLMSFQVISRTGETVDSGTIKRAEKTTKITTSR